MTYAALRVGTSSAGGTFVAIAGLGVMTAGPNDDKFLRETVAAALRAHNLDPSADEKREQAMPRELIQPKGDKRYVWRGKGGKFRESDDVGRSLAADRRKKAKRVVKKGEGDRGDQKRR